MKVQTMCPRIKTGPPLQRRGLGKERKVRGREGEQGRFI